MLFNDFIHEYNFENKATSNVKIQQILSSLSLKDVGIFLGDGTFKADMGIVNLHPFQDNHWVLYVHENFFDSYGCSPPQNLPRFIIKRNGHCIFSESKKQGLTNEKDSFCAGNCLYIIYLTKVAGKNSKSAVLKLYHQKIS